jgi:hypothetical protein
MDKSGEDPTWEKQGHGATVLGAGQVRSLASRKTPSIFRVRQVAFAKAEETHSKICV